MCGLCKLLSYCTLRLWDRSSALVGYGRPYNWSFGSLSRTWDGQSRAAPRRQCYLLMCQETFKETKASHHMFFSLRCGPRDAVVGDGVGTPSDFFFKPESELPKSSTLQPCKQVSAIRRFNLYTSRYPQFHPKTTIHQCRRSLFKSFMGIFLRGTSPRIPRLGGRVPRPPPVLTPMGITELLQNVVKKLVQ